MELTAIFVTRLLWCHCVILEIQWFKQSLPNDPVYWVGLIKWMVMWTSQWKLGGLTDVSINWSWYSGGWCAQSSQVLAYQLETPVSAALPKKTINCCIWLHDWCGFMELETTEQKQSNPFVGLTISDQVPLAPPVCLYSLLKLQVYQRLFEFYLHKGVASKKGRNNPQSKLLVSVDHPNACQPLFCQGTC